MSSFSLRSSARSAIAHPALRALLAASALVAAAAGCDQEIPPPTTSQFLGTYAVTVEVEGKADTTTMTVLQGSGPTIVLEFTHGISQVRCTAQDATQLSVPRQQIELLESTGRIDGTATGMGSILSDGTVDITLNVIRTDVSSGTVDLDAGEAMGAGVEYRITGTKTF